MAKKKKVASAAAAGGQHRARDPSPDHSFLDGIERRGHIDQLRSKLDDVAADHSVLDGIERDVFRLILSSQLTHAAACGSAELRRIEAFAVAECADAKKTAASLQVKADLAASELHEAEMSLLAMVREKAGVEMDLKRAVGEKELSWRDLDVKMKEMAYSEESLRSMEQELARISSALQVAEENRGKLEEEGKRKEEMLRSIMLEKASLESCLEEEKQLVDKLASDMKEMGSRKEAEMEVLNAENKAIAIKVSTFENQCRYLVNIKDQLQNEVRHLKASLDELKKENVKLFDEVKMWRVRYEEQLKSSQNKFELKVGEMNLQMNELKDNMAKMAGEKDLFDQRRGEYEIEIGRLIEEKMELTSARKSLEEANFSFHKKIAKKDAEFDAAHRDLKLKEKEVVALEKHLVSAQEALSDIEKQQKASEMTSVRALVLLRNTATEVLGLERAQENITSVENGAEVEEDETLQPFVIELKAIKMKIEDMNQELELMQLTVADTQKSSRAVWKWLCPATTTIFAAVSLVYVARAR